MINTHVIFSALLGAIFWNIFTWYYGLPSSSSHALIGGLLGASYRTCWHCATKMGWHYQSTCCHRYFAATGMVMGMILMVITARIFFYSNPHRVEGWFRKFNWFLLRLSALAMVVTMRKKPWVSLQFCSIHPA